MTRYTNMSNPSSIGCDVVTADNSRLQFVVIRDVGNVYFSMHSHGTWTPMSAIVNPERFALAIPGNYRTLRAFAEAFVAAGTS